MKVKPSLLLNTSLCYATPIFIIEALCLAANVQLLKTTLLWNKQLIYHYLSLSWQMFTTCFISNYDHAHLSGHKNDTHISNMCMGLRLCLSSRHTQSTICGQEQLQETMPHYRPYLGHHMPGFSSMQLWLKVIATWVLINALITKILGWFINFL